MSDEVSVCGALPTPGNMWVFKTWPLGHELVTLMVVDSGIMRSHRLVF